MSLSPSAEAIDDDLPAPPDTPRESLKGRYAIPFKRVVGSLLAVIAVYVAYSLLAVPFIEPPAAPRPTEHIDETGREMAKRAAETQRQSLTPWFKQGDWELSALKVIDWQRPSHSTAAGANEVGGKLLIRDYEVLRSGQLKLWPCTLVILPQGSFANAEERNRRAVILQAPQAVLEFDPPLDTKQLKPGKLVGGILEGNITIRSDQRDPGPHDDLWITTRDVEFTGDRIVTAHAVEFRLGLNRGSGREMEIQLSPAAAPAKAPAPDFGGVNSFMLKHDVRMTLYPGRADVFPGGLDSSARMGANVAADQPPQAARNENKAPVEIRCDGHFVFDVLRYVAKFHERVDVLRLNPIGASDQLTCELLSLHFEPETVAGQPPTTPRPARRATKLEPSRVEAEGNPVVIRSPSRGLQARGTYLDYDIKKNSGGLRGPGWLMRNAADDPRAAPVEASWVQQLSFQPHEDSQLVSLIGAAHVASRDFELNSDEIYLYLSEQQSRQADGTIKRELIPDKLQACLSPRRIAPDKSPPAASSDSTRPPRYVQIRSPELSANVNHLQVWFERQGSTSASISRLPQTGTVAVTSTSPNRDPLGSPQASRAPATAQRHFHVDGELLQVNAVLRPRADVRNVHVESKRARQHSSVADEASPFDDVPVEIVETQVADPANPPLRIRGDVLDMERLTAEQSIVQVMGRPARIEARGMTIDGGSIHMDQSKNLAWVKGQGKMTLPAPTEEGMQPRSEPQNVDLTWKGRMDFDGKEATFQDSVVTLLDQQRLTTEWLRATFSHRIRFGDAGNQPPPQVERIACRRGVYLEQQTIKEGKLASRERLKVIELTIENATRDFVARGPGWMRTVRIDNGEGFQGVPLVQPVNDKPAERRGEKLVFLGIHFEGRATGNQLRNVAEFSDRVRCAYGPVADWDTLLDPDSLDHPSADQSLLTCDTLQVAQMRAPNSREPTAVLTALGNATVLGQLYSARAARLTYEQAKEQLVLEGDGFGPAVLSRREQIGAPWVEIPAGKVEYYPKTQDFKLRNPGPAVLENVGGPNAASRR